MRIKAPAAKVRFEIGVLAVGVLVPCAIVGFLAALPILGVSFTEGAPLTSLFGARWRAATGEFGIASLLIGTIVCAAIATAVSIVLGILAATHLATRAGPIEQYLGEASLAAMSALPSVVVGLVGLDILVPLFGFSAATAVPTLVLMILPTVALLALAALRDILDRLRDQARALGYEEHQITWLAIRSARRRLIACGLLGLARACGEATAVSMVAGNPPSGLWAGLNAPARTITSTVLIEHGGATGTHQAALFMIATVLGLLIVVLTLCGRMLLGAEK